MKVRRVPSDIWGEELIVDLDGELEVVLWGHGPHRYSDWSDKRIIEKLLKSPVARNADGSFKTLHQFLDEGTADD